MKDVSDILGRIFISIMFYYEVLDTLIFYENTKETMTSYGVTWCQDILLISIIVILLIGSTMVAIGYSSRFGAVLLLLYIVPFTFIVYSFWNDPQELQQLNMLYFMRNLAIMGGLLLLLAHGSGRYSVKRLIHVMRLPK